MERKTGGLTGGVDRIHNAIVRASEYREDLETASIADVLGSAIAEGRYHGSMELLVDRFQLYERKVELIEKYSEFPDVFYIKSKISKGLEASERRRVARMQRDAVSFRRLSRQLARAIIENEVGLVALFAIELMEVKARIDESWLEAELYAGRASIQGAVAGGSRKSHSAGTRQRNRAIVRAAKEFLVKRPDSRRADLVRFLQKPGQPGSGFSYSTVSRALRDAGLPTKRA